jgi:DNA-binding transcriptional LysR family regulator
LPGAIAQQVRSLEAHLGVALFDRLPRQLVLTAPGKAYLPALRDALGRIAAATDRVRPVQARAVVRLGVHGATDFADLVRRIARFRDEQPTIHVPISRPAGLHELAEGKIDVLIDRSGESRAGYRCDPLPADGEFLIYPAGTADCAEIIALREFLLAPVYA